MRKLSSVFLFAVMIISMLLIPASATSTSYSEEELDVLYDFHTITVPLDINQAHINSSDELSYATLEAHNQQNYELIREYVRSLGLDKIGLGYIETACLNELDALSKENFIIESYTVLTPKTRASYSLYGTYNGVDFYSSYYSTRSGYSEKLTTSAKDTLVSWMSGAATLWVEIEYEFLSIPFALFEQLAGIDNIVYYPGSAVQYYCRINATSFGVFTKAGSNYTLRYSTEKGTASPYIVYHNEDPYNPVATATLPVQNVSAPSYNDKNLHLMSAYAVYLDGAPPVKMFVNSNINWGFASN